MRKIIIGICLALSFMYAEDFEIPEDNVVVVENSEAKGVAESSGELNNLKNIEETAPVVPEVKKVVEKFKPKNFNTIKYNKGLEEYSIIAHDKQEFVNFINYLKLPDLTIEGMLGSTDSSKAIRLNAYAYDYAKKQPNIAENYYLLFQKKEEIPFYDKKLRYADYLLRTGRPKEILDLIPQSDCNANFKLSHICNYYRGVARFLSTGDNKNSNLRMSKNYIPKAKEIYNKK